MTPDPHSIKTGIILAVLAVILYDIYLAQDDVLGNTYSEVLRGWFKSFVWLYYLTAFVIGTLMAHWGVA